jgi:hypothetical protein
MLCVAERPGPLTKLLVTVGQGRRRAKVSDAKNLRIRRLLALCFPT